MKHFQLVERERAFYKTQVQRAQDVTKVHKLVLGPHQCSSIPIEVHISFDYAQQVHIPFDPQQSGSIYFLVPFKVGLFGIMNEGVSKQVNFLIPESVDVGKGSNSVISYLDHYLNYYGFGETDLIIHADNCTGQNKNNFAMAYLLWRVMSGRHRKITFCFLPVGHTQFSPDWAFGLLKQKFMYTKVNTLAEMATCVESSSPVSGVNIACLTGTEGGDVLVPVFNFQEFLQEVLEYRKLPNIKKYHYFVFQQSTPGVVTCRTEVQSDSLVTWQMSKLESVDIDRKPSEIKPSGLSLEIKWYLYKNIRQFCATETQDIMCPKPDGDGPPEKDVDTGANLVSNENVDSDETSHPEGLGLPRRKVAKCTFCGEPGHRNAKKKNGAFLCPLREKENEPSSSS